MRGVRLAGLVLLGYLWLSVIAMLAAWWLSRGSGEAGNPAAWTGALCLHLVGAVLTGTVFARVEGARARRPAMALAALLSIVAALSSIAGVAVEPGAFKALAVVVQLVGLFGAIAWSARRGVSSRPATSEGRSRP